MKSKLFTLTATLIALMSLSVLAAAQGKAKVTGPLSVNAPRVSAVTNLKCDPYNKEMNEKIILTNNTSKVVKKGTLVMYTIGVRSSKFTLASDLAVNGQITPKSFAYEGQPSCKAWY